MTSKNQNPPASTWQARGMAKAEESGYADPKSMVAKTEKRVMAANWHLFPWKHGVWVAIDGTVYRGHGGNEREEYYWYRRGPWILLTDDQAAGLDRDQRGRAEDWKDRHDKLLAEVTKFVGAVGFDTEED